MQLHVKDSPVSTLNVEIKSTFKYAYVHASNGATAVIIIRVFNVE